MNSNLPTSTVIPKAARTFAGDRSMDIANAVRGLTAASAEPLLQARITFGAAVSNTRRVKIQVVNPDNKPCFGLFNVHVVIGLTESGGPGGVQTVTLVTGTTIASVVSHQYLHLLTDANGIIEFDLNVLTGTPRHVRVVAVSAVHQSGSMAF